MNGALLRVRLVAPDVYLLRQQSWSSLTVNLYALVGDSGVTLVDAGFPNRTAELAEALSQVGLDLDDVGRVLYTHTHIDHMGGGPALAARTTAEHVVWHESRTVVADWQAHQRTLDQWDEWRRAVVDDPDVLAALERRREASRPHWEEQRQGPTRIEPVRPLGPGERVQAGPFQLEMLPAPGHDPHHVVLYDRDRRVAFTGDVVLPVATPICRPMGDDLVAYLATLERLEVLPVDVAYPGHGRPTQQFAKRVAKSRQFVEQRHEAILAFAAGQTTTTLLELARHLAGPTAQQLSQLSILLANVDSSVRYLITQGRLRWIAEPHLVAFA